MNSARGVMYGSVVVMGAIVAGLVIADRSADDRSNVVKTMVPKIEKRNGRAEPKSEPADAVSKPDVEQVIASALSSLESQTPEEKVAALGGLVDDLQSPDYVKETIPQKSGEAIAQAWFGLVQQSTSAYKDNAETSLKAVKFLASRTRGKTTEAGILDILEHGPDELRTTALEGIGSPHGLHGPAIFAKIKELGEDDVIESASVPGLLMRTGGKKAIAPIVALLKQADEPKTISACVVALQNYQDPQLLGDVLERLDQLGMLEDPNKLPWISGKLLAKHLEKADDAELLRAVKMMSVRPSLVKPGLAFATKGLDASDPQMRRLSATAIKKAALARQIDAASGEKLLAGRLNQETEPVLKLELAGGLEEIHGLGETKEPVETTN